MSPSVAASQRGPVAEECRYGSPPTAERADALGEDLVLLGIPLAEPSLCGGDEDLRVSFGALVVLPSGYHERDIMPGWAELFVGGEEGAVLLLGPSTFAESWI